jgi:hypothetical protein
MRAVIILFAFAAWSLFASAFAQFAALLASMGSPLADPIGFTGLGIAALGFTGTSIYIWRTV